MNHFLGAVVISRGYSPQRCRSCSRKVKHTRPLLLFHPVTDREISTGVWGGGERGSFQIQAMCEIASLSPILDRYFPLISRLETPIVQRQGCPQRMRRVGVGGGGVLHLCGWRAGDGTNEG